MATSYVEVYDSGKIIKLPVIAIHQDGKLIEVDYNGNNTHVVPAVLFEDGSVDSDYSHYTHYCDHCDDRDRCDDCMLGTAKEIYVFK